MTGHDVLRARLLREMSGADTARAAADALCGACMAPLDVDGAWISVSGAGGESNGTFGSSSELCRELDELQFTFSEGPGPNAVLTSRPVLAPDLDDPAENRWPVFQDALLRLGIVAVFALPVMIATRPIGSVALFRRRAGPLAGAALPRALVVAQLAALPLLELIDSEAFRQRAGSGQDDLPSGARGDVYRATGMLMEAMGIGPAEALLRLRAHAVAQDTTAAEVATTLLERRSPMLSADWSDGNIPPH